MACRHMSLHTLPLPNPQMVRARRAKCRHSNPNGLMQPCNPPPNGNELIQQCCTAMALFAATAADDAEAAMALLAATAADDAEAADHMYGPNWLMQPCRKTSST